MSGLTTFLTVGFCQSSGVPASFCKIDDLTLIILNTAWDWRLVCIGIVGKDILVQGSSVAQGVFDIGGGSILHTRSVYITIRE